MQVIYIDIELILKFYNLVVMWSAGSSVQNPDIVTVLRHWQIRPRVSKTRK